LFAVLKKNKNCVVVELVKIYFIQENDNRGKEVGSLPKPHWKLGDLVNSRVKSWLVGGNLLSGNLRGKKRF
jgi:hypothetical protein